MTRGEGQGWHRESRRHSEAARKGRPTHATRREGHKRKARKRPIENEMQRFRQACRHTKVSEMEPCMICGAPIPKQYDVCPSHGDDFQ